MKKNVFALCVLVFAMLLTGCVSEPKKDFFADHVLEYELVENVIIEPEFTEYPPDTERILVKVINDNDTNFYHDPFRPLQKEENGEWRDVRSEGIYVGTPGYISANSTIEQWFIYLNHFPNPLPEGKYRMGIGTNDPPRYAWFEFTIK